MKIEAQIPTDFYRKVTEKHIMQEKGKKDPLLENAKFQKLPKYFISARMAVQMVLMSLVMAGGSLYLFSLYYRVDYARAVTVCLTSLAAFQWYNGFNSRFLDRTVFKKDFFSNPYILLAFGVNLGLQIFAVQAPFMQKILKTTPLSLGEWFAILGLSFSVILVEEIRKLVVLIISRSKAKQA